MDFFGHIQTALAELPPHITIKWLLLATVSIVIVILITVEQRRMYRYYQRLTSHASKEDSSVAEYSLKLLSLSTRNKFLFSISFLIMTFSVIVYDVRQQHMTASHEVEIAQRMAEDCEARINAQTAKTTSAISAASEESLDRIKQKYEQIFVNFYLLQKCGSASVEDFSLLHSAILTELRQLNADADLAKKIINTAKSTFDELYKDFNCKDAKAKEIAIQFQEHRKNALNTISSDFNL